MYAHTKTWGLEKYQRLDDLRSNPMIIEKRHMNDLSIQVNMNLKMLSVVNNGIKLEEFCFSPLVYPHEIICKDVRVLFNVKNQKDGCLNGKFRVRFRALDLCQNFCSFLSNFLIITMYEELQQQRRDSSQNLLNLSSSTSVFNLSAQTDGSYGGVLSVEAPEMCDSFTQTDPLPSMNTTARSPFSVGSSPSSMTNSMIAAVQPTVVNVHIESLISDNAMSNFTSMVDSFFGRLFAMFSSAFAVAPILNAGWRSQAVMNVESPIRSKTRAATKRKNTLEYRLPDNFNRSLIETPSVSPAKRTRAAKKK